MGLLSKTIEEESLKPGDHIYSWRTGYSHHGIYVENDKVVHLSSSAPARSQVCPTCTPPEEGHEVVSSCLNCFRAGGVLYHFKYAVSCALFLAKARGTCTLAVSDPDGEVVRRASRLLEIGFGRYNVFGNNCEHFAIYCKTELFVPAQFTMGQSDQAVPLIEILSAISSILDMGTTNVYGIATKAAATLWDYCARKCADDITMRRDVKKVSVDELKRRLEPGKLQGIIPPATNDIVATSTTHASENNGELLKAIESLAKILEHHINATAALENNGEVLKAIESLAKIVERHTNATAAPKNNGEVLKAIENLAKIVENHIVRENTNKRATEEVNSALEQFINLEPPIFNGTSGPLEAQSWIAEIENIFEVMRCPDMQKVTFAVSMLIEKADYWWKCTKKLLPEPVTWESFTKAFNEKYFSEPVRD